MGSVECGTLWGAVGLAVFYNYFYKDETPQAPASVHQCLYRTGAGVIRVDYWPKEGVVGRGGGALKHRLQVLLAGTPIIRTVLCPTAALTWGGRNTSHVAKRGEMRLTEPGKVFKLGLHWANELFYINVWESSDIWQVQYNPIKDLHWTNPLSEFVQA